MSKPIFKLNEKQHLRAEREILLSAWDKLVGNVNFGVTKLTADRKTELRQWHAAILDLDNLDTAREAIHNVPDEVAYYLPR